PSDHERTFDARSLVHNRLDLDAKVVQRLVERLWREVGRQVHVLPQPGQSDPHCQWTSMSNARLNRTSPSIISRMSERPLRNISVRSIPMPNANPEYPPGSIPPARRTFGLTIPQPPHSTHCGPSRCSANQTSNSADGSVNGK